MSGEVEPSRLRSWAGRFLLYLFLWIVMVGGGLADLAAGAVAAVAATWCSMALMPPDPAAAPFRPLRWLGLMLRFIWGSVRGGFDVARQAFRPQLALRPGYHAYAPGLAPGAPRDLFLSITSLLPGTLCVGTDESGALVYHCLDVDKPVAEELAEEEARVMAILGVAPAAVPGSPAGPGRPLA
jgi:multicomponent Na+:H+ antiporter subunit E